MVAPTKRPTWLRYLTSCAASALLWLPLPFALNYFAPTTTDYGRQYILQRLPAELPIYFGAFFVIALLMHRLFARIVLRLRGGRFWLLPLATLPVAASLAGIIGFFGGLLFRQPFYFPSFEVFIANFFYSWFIAIVIVMFSCIWASYPIAMLNQFLIRRLLSNATGIA